MGRLPKSTPKRNYFLTYDEIIKIVPELENKLNEKQTLEFSIYLLEFTNLLIEEIRNEKKFNN